VAPPFLPRADYADLPHPRPRPGSSRRQRCRACGRTPVRGFGSARPCSDSCWFGWATSPSTRPMGACECTAAPR